MNSGRDPQPMLATPVARRVFLRSLTLQASYNDQRMQNLGLLATLAPWLRDQGLRREQLRRICRRYYGYFNTNPYLANFVVGGLLHLEHHRLGGGTVPERLVVGFRDTLARACGSLGDQLFWLGLRPALLTLACLLAVVGRWESILALLAIFTLTQLGLRRRALQLGYGLGSDVVDVLAQPIWHRSIAWAGRAALFLTGVVAGLYFAGAASLGSVWGTGPLIGAAVVGLLLPMLLQTKVTGEVQLLLALAAAALLAALFRDL
jgi:PTS system mannose-specific IID component